MADSSTKEVSNGRKFTIKQLQEIKEAGLCFKCDEKFMSGDRCKKLFTIEAVRNDHD